MPVKIHIISFNMYVTENTELRSPRLKYPPTLHL